MHSDPFEEYRSLLFALAYRMLGSAMEAEDMVQEAYLRYRATPPQSIHNLKSYLTTIVHRLCIDQLKSARARRENYVGPWLPEPIITDNATPTSPLRQITEWESISMAFLVLLESLSPLERAVFLLREVFDYEYAEIAEITGRDEVACRQLFSRAKKHIRENHPRFPASPEAHRRIVGRFMDACMAGDLDGLANLLTEDVTVWMDNGGKVAAGARQMVQGRAIVARGMLEHLGHAPEGTTITMIEVNGLPALLQRFKGEIVSVITLDVEQDRIRTVRTILNPDKLAHLKTTAVSGQEWRIES